MWKWLTLLYLNVEMAELLFCVVFEMGCGLSVCVQILVLHVVHSLMLLGSECLALKLKL
jgi:hypothetical protein